MANNPLLQALRKNLEPTEPSHDFTTVRGLFEFCCLWLDEEVTAEQLNNPCLEMANRLRLAGGQAEADLDANEQLNPELMGHLERIAEAYYNIADALENLPELAKADHEDKFEQELELFEQEREAVLEEQACLERLRSDQILRCPSCGQSGSDAVCPECDVLHLFPDPSNDPLAGSRETWLPSGLIEVQEAVLKILSGQLSLLDALPIFVAGDQYLDQLSEALESLSQDGHETVAGVESRFVDHLDRASGGIDRLLSVEESLRCSDLRRGWEQLYAAVCTIQRMVGKAGSGSPHQDSVQLSGEA